ncbi:MAG: endo-1,4-beta-xylanase [Planctomycetes bacterium]|nr:endo-1,4-beta-xylanase [Planctomycetota bacterium]
MKRKIKFFVLFLVVAGMFLCGCGAGFVEGAEVIDRSKSLDENIAENRMGEILIETTPGAKVKVGQLEHEFIFGSCLNVMLFSDMEDFKSRGSRFKYYKDPKGPYYYANREQYLKAFKENFNYGVHQNALKWLVTEREQAGDVYYTAAEKVSQWCKEQGIGMRGHCIFWEKEKYVQEWLKQLSDEEAKRRMEIHCKEVVNRFKDHIHEWDLNNEMVDGRYFRERFGEEIVGDMCRWAKEADESARLFFNDYDVLVKHDNYEDYVKQIEGYLAKGYPFDGIGVQAHSWWVGKQEVKRVEDVLDRLSRTGLSIKITEYVANYGVKDEATRAQKLREFYRVCFAHPGVDAIIVWGFWEGSMWLDEYGFYDRDWKLTELGQAYRQLVLNEWWTNFEGKANEKGLCKVPAFFGKHNVEVNGKKREVYLHKSDGKVRVEMRQVK